jgi:succinoglycan biosynthesis protein ExoA
VSVAPLDASVLIVSYREPITRLQRALDALSRQERVSIEVLIACCPEERAALEDLRVGGPVRSLRLVANPSGGRSAGLNRALALATAPVVMRVDARSVPPPRYVTSCVERLRSSSEVGVVGAIQRARPEREGWMAAGVARALRNPYALGAATYRRIDGGGEADTAYLGAFRRDELRSLGGFDERLTANEDFDVCERFRRRGATIWVEPGLVVEYEARAGLRDLWAQYRAFGQSKADYWKLSGNRPNGRQTAALLGGASAVVCLGVAARSPRLGAGMALSGLAGLVALDHYADPHESDVRARAASVGASAVVMGAWLSGVASGVVRRVLLSRPSQGPTAPP